MDDTKDSSPREDKKSEDYEADNEISSQDISTDTASEASVDDKMDDLCSLGSSNATKTVGDLYVGKKKNEGFAEDAHGDHDSSDKNIENEICSSEFPDIKICDVCYTKFSDKDQLWDHKTVRPRITYWCEECDKQFQTECTFESHKLVEHAPCPFSPEKNNFTS